MDAKFICDECGNETKEEFSHDRIQGILCMDCYDKIWFKYAFQEGEAWIRERLPSIEQLALCWGGRLAVPKMMEDNCHSAACALKKMLLEKQVEVKVKRGHWLGPDCRLGHTNRVISQHSWLEVMVPNSEVRFYVDPTQWVFNASNPTIDIIASDDYRYDAASHKIREIFAGSRELPERVEDDLVLTHLKPAARKVLTARFGDRDWNRWSRAECFVIANKDPATYGGFAKEIFDALIASKFKPLIPFCSYEEVYRDGNHD